MINNRAALLDSRDKVIGEVFDAPITGNTIKIAGAYTVDGTPVNVKTFRISRSKRNLEKAQFEQPVYLDKNGCYTFGTIDENGEPIY